MSHNLLSQCIKVIDPILYILPPLKSAANILPSNIRLLFLLLSFQLGIIFPWEAEDTMKSPSISIYYNKSDSKKTKLHLDPDHQLSP